MKISTTVKEYAWSSFVTFVAAFMIAAESGIGTVTLTKAALFALFAAAARSGFKAVLNLVTTKLQTISSVPIQ